MNTITMAMKKATKAGLAALLFIAAMSVIAAEKSVLDEYRDMLKDGNPAELFEIKGKELFETKAGPLNADLSGCDLGLGKGVVKGAYAQLPRYFADSGRVQDAESRLAWCMVTLQGVKAADIARDAFRTDTMPALVSYVASQSNGMRFAAPVKHSMEKQALAAGQQLFWQRRGPSDFSCATCHSENGKRIRLQELPNLTSNPAQAATTMGSWPTYRVSHGTVRTMQHRLSDCLSQMRLPDVTYDSEVVAFLHTYLTHQAKGGLIELPSIKR